MELISRIADRFYDFLKGADKRENCFFRNYREAYKEWEKRTQKINEMGLPNGELSLALYMAEYDFIISRLPSQDKNRFDRVLKRDGFEIKEEE